MTITAPIQYRKIEKGYYAATDGNRVVMVQQSGRWDNHWITNVRWAPGHAFVTGHSRRDAAQQALTVLAKQDAAKKCHCMTEDPGDGLGERVVTHSGGCPLHPEYDPAQS